MKNSQEVEWLTKSLRDMQEEFKVFCRERGWDKFKASNILVHLIEELGEIARHVNYEEGYKKKGLGHEGSKSDLEREFAQVLNLFIQLANHYGVDLTSAWDKELKLMKKRFDARSWKEYTDKLMQE